MGSDEPAPPITLAQLIAVTHVLGDPPVYDWGTAPAAVARASAVLLDVPVYGGPHAQAAAVLHQLVRCPMLETGNGSFAAAVADTMLSAAGRPAKYAAPQDWARLVVDVHENRAHVRDVAAALRRFTGADSLPGGL